MIIEFNGGLCLFCRSETIERGSEASTFIDSASQLNRAYVYHYFLVIFSDLPHFVIYFFFFSKLDLNYYLKEQ